MGKTTEVAAAQLRSYFGKITTPGRSSRTRLEKQFKVKGRFRGRLIARGTAPGSGGVEALPGAAEVPDFRVVANGRFRV